MYNNPLVLAFIQLLATPVSGRYPNPNVTIDVRARVAGRWSPHSRLQHLISNFKHLLCYRNHHPQESRKYSRMTFGFYGTSPSQPAEPHTHPAHHANSSASAFQNPWPPRSLLASKQVFSQFPLALAKQLEEYKVTPTKVRRPDFGHGEPDEDAVKATWLGHAVRRILNI